MDSKYWVRTGFATVIDKYCSCPYAIVLNAFQEYSKIVPYPKCVPKLSLTPPPKPLQVSWQRFQKIPQAYKLLFQPLHVSPFRLYIKGLRVFDLPNRRPGIDDTVDNPLS